MNVFLQMLDVPALLTFEWDKVQWLSKYPANDYCHRWF